MSYEDFNDNVMDFEEPYNNSGEGPNSEVPDEVANHFNWGAFLLTWIWGIGNKSIPAVMILVVGIVLGWIPFVGGLILLGYSIFLGIKGNKWAWQNKEYDSIEHFHSVQRRWAAIGLIICIISFSLIAIMYTKVLSMAHTEDNFYNIEIEFNKRLDSVNLAAVDRKYPKYEYDSNGLASYFADSFKEDMRYDFYQEGNILSFEDNSTWTFVGDNNCINEDACYVLIDKNGKEKPNKIDKDIYKINLFIGDSSDETLFRTSKYVHVYKYSPTKYKSESEEISKTKISVNNDYAEAAHKSLPDSYSSNISHPVSSTTNSTKSSDSNKNSALKMVEKFTSAMKESNIQCELNAYSLARCFAQIGNNFGEAISDGKVMTYNKSSWLFYGDGLCGKDSGCKIKVTDVNGNITIIPIYKNNEGYITTVYEEKSPDQ